MTASSGYRTAAAFRQAIEDRLRIDAEQRGRDLGWIRRRFVFVRLLHRLVATAPEEWVVKGGLAVELRRPNFARATRDLDVVIRSPTVEVIDPNAVRRHVTASLANDVDGDLLVFIVGEPRRLQDDAYGRPAWRLPIDAQLAGRSFASVRLDVVARPEELVATTTTTLPSGLPGLDAPAREVTMTDLVQQFAEKLHAYTRGYESGESSRVRDLVDLVLLIEDGLPSNASLADCVDRIFKVRATHPVPAEVPPPPASWRVPFDRLIADLGLGDMSLDRAHAVVAELWARCQHEKRS